MKIAKSARETRLKRLVIIIGITIRGTVIYFACNSGDYFSSYLATQVEKP